MLSDEQAIQEYKITGENRTIAPLFKKYSEKLFGLAYYYLSNKETAMDTVMEAYEVVLKSLAKKEVTYYKGWVMSICRNICLKKLRDGKKLVELTDFSNISVENEEELEYSDETIEKLIEYIPKLKENQRICINAFYLQAKSYEEISNSYGFSFKEVKSYIQNGKRNLKVMFEKYSKLNE